MAMQTLALTQFGLRQHVLPTAATKDATTTTAEPENRSLHVQADPASPTDTPLGPQDFFRSTVNNALNATTSTTTTTTSTTDRDTTFCQCCQPLSKTASPSPKPTPKELAIEREMIRGGVVPDYSPSELAQRREFFAQLKKEREQDMAALAAVPRRRPTATTTPTTSTNTTTHTTANTTDKGAVAASQTRNLFTDIIQEAARNANIPRPSTTPCPSTTPRPSTPHPSTPIPSTRPSTPTPSTTSRYGGTPISLANTTSYQAVVEPISPVNTQSPPNTQGFNVGEFMDEEDYEQVDFTTVLSPSTTATTTITLDWKSPPTRTCFQQPLSTT